jgi:hypothetical protein
MLSKSSAPRQVHETPDTKRMALNTLPCGLHAVVNGRCIFAALTGAVYMFGLGQPSGSPQPPSPSPSAASTANTTMPPVAMDGDGASNDGPGPGQAIVSIAGLVVLAVGCVIGGAAIGAFALRMASKRRQAFVDHLQLHPGYPSSGMSPAAGLSTVGRAPQVELPNPSGQLSTAGHVSVARLSQVRGFSSRDQQYQLAKSDLPLHARRSLLRALTAFLVRYRQNPGLALQHYPDLRVICVRLTARLQVAFLRSGDCR